MARRYEESYNPRLKTLILEIVRNQMTDPRTPYVKETYDRLVSAGHDKQTAFELIGSVVVTEIYDVMQENQPFDEGRYRRGLDALK